MTTPGYDTTQADWSELCGSLPDHQTEVMAAHTGQPSVSVQAATHGALYLPGGVPAVDRGPDPGSVVG